jgi:hypothetical protein
MFRVEIHELLFVYAGICLAGILFAVALHNFQRFGRERAARRTQLKCRLCSFEFSDTSNAVLPRCPNCQALTERQRLSQL